jgi:hypothetical protein
MITTYEHHGKTVFVDSELQGKHREHCLCHKCKFLNLASRADNCAIANKLYRICQDNNLVTPVYECPEFEEKAA